MKDNKWPSLSRIPASFSVNIICLWVNKSESNYGPAETTGHMYNVVHGNCKWLKYKQTHCNEELRPNLLWTLAVWKLLQSPGEQQVQVLWPHFQIIFQKEQNKKKWHLLFKGNVDCTAIIASSFTPEYVSVSSPWSVRAEVDWGNWLQPLWDNHCQSTQHRSGNVMWNCHIHALSPGNTIIKGCREAAAITYALIFL